MLHAHCAKMLSSQEAFPAVAVRAGSGGFLLDTSTRFPAGRKHFPALLH